MADNNSAKIGKYYRFNQSTLDTIERYKKERNVDGTRAVEEMIAFWVNSQDSPTEDLEERIAQRVISLFDEKYSNLINFKIGKRVEFIDESTQTALEALNTLMFSMNITDFRDYYVNRHTIMSQSNEAVKKRRRENISKMRNAK